MAGAGSEARGAGDALAPAGDGEPRRTPSWRDRAWLEADSWGPHREFEWSWGWWDATRGPWWPFVLVLVAMVVVIVAEGLWLADAAPPGTAALLTGAAAVVSAIAAVIEAKRGGELRGELADHEARLRVLEDRSSRS